MFYVRYFQMSIKSRARALPRRCANVLHSANIQRSLIVCCSQTLDIRVIRHQSLIVRLKTSWEEMYVYKFYSLKLLIVGGLVVVVF